MNILRIIKSVILTAGLSAAVTVPLVSCDNVIYDQEGDCTVTYRIKFNYDMNLKWANAFANEVKSVHLFAFNPDGDLVWEQREKGPQLADENYSMVMELPAGDYHLIAWCGLDNDSELPESFTIPGTTINAFKQEELICTLNRKSDDIHPAYSDERLHSLFHGTLDVTLPGDDDGGDYVYTMHLTKNTNHVRVILQQLSGEDLDVNDFEFRIEDENGVMGHDNDLLKDEIIQYRTWNTLSGEAGIGKNDYTDPHGRAGIVYVKGAIADLTVARLMESHRDDMILTITNAKEGYTVARVPLIHYALLSKDYYEEAYGHLMSDQEFLDREDEYVLTFFLDRDLKWLKTSILIHSWRVVLHDYDV